MLTGDLFRLACRLHDVTPKALAERMKYPVHLLHCILKNDRALPPKLALRIEHATHIRVSLWKSVRRQREEWWRVNRHRYLSSAAS
jgi:plasmid maintenance system antidote protein VapI